MTKFNSVSEYQIKRAYEEGRLSVYRFDTKESPYTHPALTAAWRKGRFDKQTDAA